MSIVIAVAAIVVAFFIFPVTTFEWLITKTKERASSWKTAVLKFFPKKEEKS